MSNKNIGFTVLGIALVIVLVVVVWYWDIQDRCYKYMNAFATPSGEPYDRQTYRDIYDDCIWAETNGYNIADAEHVRYYDEHFDRTNDYWHRSTE